MLSLSWTAIWKLRNLEQDLENFATFKRRNLADNPVFQILSSIFCNTVRKWILKNSEVSSKKSVPTGIEQLIYICLFIYFV